MMRARAFVLALCLLLLTGCAYSTATAGEDERTTENPAEPKSEKKLKERLEAESETGAGTDNLFEIMPRYFRFCSGVGAWGTELSIEADGGFSGLFVDSDMGASGPGYPEGTRYICVFGGQFTQPEQIAGTVWSMGIASMELEHPADGTEEYADEVRYIYSGPCGLENAEELVVYGSGTPAEDLPEEFLFWLQVPYGWEPDAAGSLDCWGIYNVSEVCGFVGFP